MRAIRHVSPGAVHHVIWQFIDREFLVLDDRMRGHYIALLGRAMVRSDWQCISFGVMSNHIHLGMIAGHTPPERWLRRVHPPFAAWLNKELGRIGAVSAGDPDIWVVHPDNERRLVAYIHNNPVRAGVVAYARESTWTSHQLLLGTRRSTWFDADAALQRLGLSASEIDAFTDASIGYAPEHAALDGIARAAHRRGALEVGTPPEGPNPLVPLVRRPFGHLRPDPMRVVEAVCEVLGLRPDRLRSRSRDATLVRARAVAVHCARALGLSISSMCAALGISSAHGSRLGLRTLTSLEQSTVSIVSSRIDAELAALLRPAV